MGHNDIKIGISSERILGQGIDNTSDRCGIEVMCTENQH